MPNFFNVLYTRYIDQIKLNQIQNYNQKHREYLIRTGKQNNNPEQYVSSKSNKNHVPNRQRPIKPNQNIQAHQAPNENQNKDIKRKKEFNESRGQSNFVQKQQSNEQRPLKPSQNNFMNNDQQYHMIPTGATNRAIKKNSYQFDQYDLNPTSNSRDQLPLSRPIKGQQRPLKATTPSPNFNQDLMENLEEDENIVLEECPEGCGRKFKASALEKHVKICQKVFQKKRKPFKVDLVDEEAKKMSKTLIQIDQKPQKTKTEKVPKWKKQSQMLRRGLKSNQQGGSTPSLPAEQEDDRVQCPGCGRKFNEDAAQRHVPNCLKRNKQKK